MNKNNKGECTHHIGQMFKHCTQSSSSSPKESHYTPVKVSFIIFIQSWVTCAAAAAAILVLSLFLEFEPEQLKQPPYMVLDVVLAIPCSSKGGFWVLK